MKSIARELVLEDVFINFLRNLCIFSLLVVRYNEESLETRLAKTYGASFENDCSSFLFVPSFPTLSFLVAAARENGEETKYKYARARARATSPLLQPDRVSIDVNPTSPGVYCYRLREPPRSVSRGQDGQC